MRKIDAHHRFYLPTLEMFQLQDLIIVFKIPISFNAYILT